ncbi:pyridoxal phosphate-dependent transferase [Bisporella sp. PMI_857]|nr:pyridoxal phosphate-dependent transferase [Bisporella sp. PMI_857]
MAALDTIALATATKAIDMSHHVNTHSKSRPPNFLKGIIQYMSYGGMVSLAGGLPHPSLFPFQSANIQTFPHSAEARPDQLISLASALQYGSGSGDASLVKWAHDFTKKVFKPAYGDWEILLHNGNTDGWAKIVRLLCEPGDYILTERHTFSSSQSVWIPMGIRAVPIDQDGRGLIPEALDAALANWEAEHPGIRRPHLLNIVPVGSNPAGTTMDGARRKEIYDLCVKYDIIIAEDDPYFFLQFPVYKLGESSDPTPIPQEEFVKSLVPSFLEFDTQGRVIRLDTFSKTLGPGLRLGYFVANPQFKDLLLRGAQCETQAPSGWSQAIVASLLSKWAIGGYLEWVSNLRGQYLRRRNWMIDSLAANFTIKPAADISIPGAEGFVAYLKDTDKPIFSFVPPTGGMFIWTRFLYSQSPRFLELQKDEKVEDPEKVFGDELWTTFADSLVLLGAGIYFEPWQGKDKQTTKAAGGEEGIGYFRLAYSYSTKEEMELGIQRFAAVIKDVF